MIRTPDQRLRVFVSSTLQELAPERTAARAAIDQLRLVPVMFELGARPHPPAELYRAYLDQSHVFVGLYWQRYGWVAPDMDVSGLEDEWNLAAGHPKLVYLKHPAPEREARLDALLDRIRDGGSTSYRTFSTPDELRELLETDLAILLSERFEDGADESGTHATDATDLKGRITVPASHALPNPPTRLIGRDLELATLRDLITEPDARLVTISGPGGSGKTRLAVEVGTTLRDQLGWDVAFADLTGLRTSALVLPTIAASLGVKDAGDRSLAEAIAVVLHDREVVAVVDNYEHVIDTAAELADVLAAAPGLRLIVTSRQALRLRWEREFPLPPLELPVDGGPENVEAIGASPAVELLVDRIRRVRPDFALDDHNAAALAEICRRLDGLPLAIELAAARLRVLSPQELLRRLEHRLDSLAAPSPDAPDRHRTLRATIAWSHDHLSPDEQRVFRRLGVFAGGAGLEAVEVVCADDDVDPTAVLDLVAGLVDKSLVVSDVDAAGHTRFRLLETIREFAVEALFDAGEVEATWDRHLGWYVGLAERAWDGFWTAAMPDWLVTVQTELDNLRSALDHAAGAGDPLSGLRIGAALWPFWDVRGHYREGARRLAHLLERAPATPSPERGRALSAHGWLVALLGDFEAALALIDEGLPQVRAGGTDQQLAWTLAEQANVAFSLGDADRARASFAESLALARAMGDTFLTGMGLFGAAFVAFLDGDIDAMEKNLDESLELTRLVIQPWGIAWAEFSLGVVATMRGDATGAVEHLTSSLELRWSIRDARGLAESIQLLASLESEEGEHEWSALLHGAAEMQRDANGLAILPFLEPLHAQSVQRLQAALGAEATAHAWRLGRSMPLEKVVAEALSRSGSLAY